MLPVLDPLYLSRRNQNDTLVETALSAGYSLVDILSINLSPIIFDGYQGHSELIRRTCSAYGYAYDFVSAGPPSPAVPKHYGPWGRYTLTKVG